MTYLCEFVLYNGITASTRRTYASGIRRYLEFCRLFHLEPFPAKVPVLAHYFVWRVFVVGKRKPNKARDYEKLLSFSTIQVNMSAIISAHVDRGLPADAFKTVEWKRIERGWHRILGDGEDKREPFTVSLLKKVAALLPHNLPLNRFHFMNLTYLTIMTVCVYGVARLREIVWDYGIEQLRALRLSNISFKPSAEKPQRLLIVLLGSKTDYWNLGVTLALPCVCGTDSPCPTCLLNELLKRRRALNLPSDPMDKLWIDVRGKVIRATQVVEQMRTLLAELKLDPDRYNGHSFRKGGCQSMIDAGCSVEDAKCAGRWLSDSVRVYFKRSPAERARIAAMMSLS